ncbi:MAG: hypothetical protein IT258_19145 [Saprospiraceae bacterium]|nr:hypothetical protein [Saprospiraceae bacterium]
MANLFEPLGISAAFDMLENSWFISELELMHMKNETVKQFAMVEDRYGKPLKAVIVKEEEVMPILYRLTVVKRYENHGLRLVFTFYYGKDDKWCLNGFKWDDSITSLFDK